MSARYELRLTGVFDTEKGEHLTPSSPGWPEYQAWRAAGGLPAIATPIVGTGALGERRKRRKAALAGARAEREEAAVVSVAGRDFRLTAALVARLSLYAAVIANGVAYPPAGTVWIDVEGNGVILAAADFRALAIAAAGRLNAIAAREAEIAAAIEVGDPDQIDVESGWPG